MKYIQKIYHKIHQREYKWYKNATKIHCKSSGRKKSMRKFLPQMVFLDNKFLWVNDIQFSTQQNTKQNTYNGIQIQQKQPKLDKKQRNNGKSIKHAENRQNAIKK